MSTPITLTAEVSGYHALTLPMFEVVVPAMSREEALTIANQLLALGYHPGLRSLLGVPIGDLSVGNTAPIIP